jgi:eukaryotic-like serine/threonine-protein kinase
MAQPKKLKTAFDEYSVKRVIGEGGAGYVLEVTASDGTPLAAKYLRAASVTTERLRRFRNEIDFCYRTRHEQIIRVIDHGVMGADESPFYVMPLYATTLRKVMEDRALSPAKRFEILIRMLTGVEAAHLHGVAHRDLKPENILLSRDASQVVVADFGIAGFIEAEMATAVETRDATRLANFKYAAPEQLERASSGDRRSDIFALGLILNEVFTGKLARGSDYRRIAAVASEFAYLDEVVELMIRQLPEARIGSLGEVKDQISARSKVAIARQKVDAVSREVVPDSELDDPLVRTPPKLEVKDWANDRLTFRLSPAANFEWKSVFGNSGYDEMYADSTPERAVWHPANNEFTVTADARSAPVVRQHYEKHINRTNERYAMVARQAHRERLQSDRRQLEDKARKEAERLNVLESLRKR